MKLSIEINEEHITKLVEEEIANLILKEQNHDINIGIKYGIEKAVKEYIYTNWIYKTMKLLVLGVED